MGQISLEKAYLLAPYFEGLVYGLFLCLFGVTLYLYFNPTKNKRRQDNHTSVMISISAIMFLIATLHLAINCYRLLQGYADNHIAPSGPAVYLSNLKAWHYILKDVLFATQQILGSAAATYRTWVLWSYNWKVVVLPIILLAINIIAGSLICAAYTEVGSIFSVIVFDRLGRTYNSIAFASSVLTVGLMSYRIWSTHRNTANYHFGRGKLLSIMWILIESAALQIITEFMLLISFFSHNSFRYIVIEWITPMVGITFNSVTVCIKLQSLKEAEVRAENANNPVQTIGSMPMHHIKINITKEVENDAEVSKGSFGRGIGVKHDEGAANDA
ncbi:hypothetical protein BDQ17DRAFT_1432717 [Cyathus striatus]|nr:hypothetical protein BDQ17DRAFT_1432717 [Cyathus striatus]